jgi:hypothetical protein
MKLQDAQKKLEDEQKKLEDEQEKLQDAKLARSAADKTLSNFLLLPDAPALGSEPSSSTVTLTPSVVHGDQGAPETTTASGDIKTAELYGRHIAEITEKLVK